MATKTKRKFAPFKEDVMIMKRYRYYIHQTDYNGTQMCMAEASRLDAAEDSPAVYCAGCKKLECVRNCNSVTTTQLWRNIQKINPRL